MAVLNGGLFSNPRGKTGGLVFGAARTRTGKKVTSRLLVPPSNPNTAAQQTQRNKFKEALAIVRLIGSGIYESDWNRAIGQLPGFQSMMNVFLSSLNASKQITTIPPINLGSLHDPNSITPTTGATSGVVDVFWSDELGINGTGADVAVLIGVETDPAATPLERVVSISTAETRTNAAATVSGFGSNVNVSVLLYFRGAGTAEGLLSPTKFGQVASGS